MIDLSIPAVSCRKDVMMHVIMVCFPCVVRIKEDGRLIQAEGIESLLEAELRKDCRERGMLGVLSLEEMRQQVLFLV